MEAGQGQSDQADRYEGKALEEKAEETKEEAAQARCTTTAATSSYCPQQAAAGGPRGQGARAAGRNIVAHIPLSSPPTHFYPFSLSCCQLPPPPHTPLTAVPLQPHTQEVLCLHPGPRSGISPIQPSDSADRQLPPRASVLQGACTLLRRALGRPRKAGDPEDQLLHAREASTVPGWHRQRRPPALWPECDHRIRCSGAFLQSPRMWR